MNKKKIFAFMLLTTIVILLFNSCEGDDPVSSKTVPVVTTAPVSSISKTTAECGGNITSDGGSPIIARGVCWSRTNTPSINTYKSIDGTGTSSFTSSITGLIGHTLFYVRAYATNSIGTGYGDTISFYSTDSTSTVTDLDGNTYKTVKIGNQWWMAENLKVTHYQNGDSIPNVTNDNEWQNSSTGAYCEYDNNGGYVATYGRLYNGYAVDDSRDIAPTGWHVPTDAEWLTMLESLGGYSPEYRIAGVKLKESGTTHWLEPNEEATNESGFTALPGGYRIGGVPFSSGKYYSLGESASFWTSREIGFVSRNKYMLSYGFSGVFRSEANSQYGLSIRCVKD